MESLRQGVYLLGKLCEGSGLPHLVKVSDLTQVLMWPWLRNDESSEEESERSLEVIRSAEVELQMIVDRQRARWVRASPDNALVQVGRPTHDSSLPKLDFG